MEDLSIESKLTTNETNWCHLSPEMRLECIKWMDFKSKLLIRATNSYEISLIESAPKHHFDSVKVELDVNFEPKVVCKENGVETVRIESEDSKKTPEFTQKAYSLVFQILKFAVVEEMDFRANFERNEGVSEFLSVISGCSPLRFSKLALYTPKFDVVKAILKKIDNPESVELQINVEGFTVAQVAELHHLRPVAESMKVRFLNMPRIAGPYEFSTEWLTGDVAIGKIFQIHTVKPIEIPNMPDIGFDFRYTTKNDLKNMFIIVFSRNWSDAEHEFVTFVVTPAGQNPTDLKKDRQWIEDIFDYLRRIDADQRKSREELVEMINSTVLV